MARRRRKRNPSAVAGFLVLAALGVGAYLYSEYEKAPSKKKRKCLPGTKWDPEQRKCVAVLPPEHEGTFALGGDCEIIGASQNTVENQWVVASVMQQAFEEYGATIPVEGVDGAPVVGLPEVEPAIGPAPGDVDRNRFYVQAVATSLFRSLVHPNCLTKMGLAGPEGATVIGQNPFGPDFTYYNGTWPGDTKNYFNLLNVGIAAMLQAQGYVVEQGGASAAISPSPSWLLVA